MNVTQTKVSRKQVMQLYDLSKSTVLKLEREGKLVPHYYDQAKRKVYYDVFQLEKIFQPA